MKKVWEKLKTVIHYLKTNNKMFFIYICAVFLPLVLADGFLLGVLVQKEQNEQMYVAQNIANAVKFELSENVRGALEKTNSVYMSKEINDFLDYDYLSGVEYYDRKLLFKDNLYDSFFGSGNLSINIYAENESILNGDHFQKVQAAEGEVWYNEWLESENDFLLIHYFDAKDYLGTAKRKFSLIRKLDYFKDSSKNKFIKVDMDYLEFVRRLNNSGYEADVYVCSDGLVVFSNDGHLQYARDFEKMDEEAAIQYRDTLELYGKKFDIIVLDRENQTISFLANNIGYIILVLGGSIFIPGSVLMIIYQSRLERQEVDIARKSAELLALQSQINPHFLFNVLESIRMHSMLKGETETAGMIESLAVLERENVNWSSDRVRMEEELQLIEAYLQIQKYRFGERLKYSLEIDDKCKDYFIPKMTLVTFVENACVHGMEEKAAGCRVYVRIYEKQGVLNMEVEDTGSGMNEEKTRMLLSKMNECSIEDLKKEKHVGIINACLRLKMLTDNQTRFELESEEGVGTFILIRIPVKRLPKERSEEYESEGNAGR